jgi:hypothetical protein
MTSGMIFTVQFDGPVDLDSIKKMFTKYFKFRVIKRIDMETSSSWTFRFDAERNEVVFGINDVVDKKEDCLKIESDMKHIFKAIIKKYPNKVKRAVILYEAEKPLVLYPNSD